MRPNGMDDGGACRGGPPGLAIASCVALSWVKWASRLTGSPIGDVREAHPNYMGVMCGRVIQSSAPFNLAIVHGMDVHASRASNYPRRYNAAPSQELLVIRRNRDTGEVSLDPAPRLGIDPILVQGPEGTISTGSGENEVRAAVVP